MGNHNAVESAKRSAEDNASRDQTQALTPTGPQGGNSAAKIEKLFDNESLTKVDLRNKSLTAVPDGMTRLTNLQYLNLTHNNIKELPEHFFQHTALVNLLLVSNSLCSLSKAMVKFTNLTHLDLSKNKLDAIEDHLGDLVSLTEMHFHSNNISLVTPRVDNLVKLKRLNISLNKIKVVPCFSHVISLENLDLSLNRMKDFPTFKNLKSLTSLNLSNNTMRIFEEDVIEGIESIQTLDLRCNELNSLPKTISLLASLRHLHLQSNQLEYLPSTVTSLCSLEEIDLSKNNLLELPDGMNCFTKVQKLHLYHNRLKLLPDDLSGMINLKELNISSNYLIDLPLAIGDIPNLNILSAAQNRLAVLHHDLFLKLTSLNALFLQENDIKILPDSVKNLTQLKKLYCYMNKLKKLPHLSPNLICLELGWNKLQSFPPPICRTQNLVLLNLFGNFITDVPKEIGSLASLKTLQLGYNRISQLPFEFGMLINLTDLHLSGNEFSTIPEHIFKLSSLQELYFSNNRINEISQSISQLQNLKILDLCFNRLKTITKLIGKCINLTELDVSHNEIVKLPDEFSSLKNLKDLDLSGNLLKSLPESFELNNKAMKQLKISYNRLVRLPRLVVEDTLFISYAGNAPLNEKMEEDKKKEKKNKSKIEDDFVHIETDTDITEETPPNSARRKLESKSSKFFSDAKSKQKLDTRARNFNLDDKPQKNTDRLSTDVSKISNQRSSSTPSNKSSLNNKRKPKKNKYSGGVMNYKNNVGWAETRGRREDMQDTIAVHLNFRESPSMTLLSCFDGHSGERAATHAASRICDVLMSKLSTVDSTTNGLFKYPDDLYNILLENTFDTIHSEIVDQAIVDGTTALVAIIENDYNRLIIANAGDQRAVMARADGILQITIDHKPNEKNEKRRIYKTGGYISDMNRVDGHLAVSRSLGDSSCAHVSHTPDVFFISIKEDDKFLILACDGLWDVISNERAVQIVDSISCPIQAAITLRDYAYLLGSTDNISVIVYKFHPTNNSIKEDLPYRSFSVPSGKNSTQTEYVKTENISIVVENVLDQQKPLPPSRPLAPTPNLVPPKTGSIRVAQIEITDFDQEEKKPKDKEKDKDKDKDQKRKS